MSRPDARLFGIWHAATIYRAGHNRLNADGSTTAYLYFRSDGRLITNGRACGAPRYTTSGGKIRLRWQGNSTCSYVEGGTDVALHISDALRKIQATAPIGYVIKGDQLILTADVYRIVLIHADAPPPTPTPAIEPSTSDAAPATS